MFIIIFAGGAVCPLAGSLETGGARAHTCGRGVGRGDTRNPRLPGTAEAIPAARHQPPAAGHQPAGLHRTALPQEAQGKGHYQNPGEPRQRKGSVFHGSQAAVHPRLAKSAGARPGPVCGQVYGPPQGGAAGRGAQPHHEAGHQYWGPSQDLEVQHYEGN